MPWTSVDESLPEKFTEVLAWGAVFGEESPRVAIVWATSDGYWYDGFVPVVVTHWMPLPQGPGVVDV